MSKAIEGAALLAGAFAGNVALFIGTFGAATPLLMAMDAALYAGAAGMFAGAIASALTDNRGMNITTRQPASPRQIIYGTQRVGGTIIYSSTTGSTNNQYNRIIVIAGHECAAIQALYLSGRLVYFDTSSAGNVTRNGINFGGSANFNNYYGPDGVQYGFGGLVFCGPHFGDQVSGDYDTAMQANDSNWGPSASGNPYVGGCTYVYLKVEYDPIAFPRDPEIRFTVYGKPVYDPRTGETAYSSNAALIAADWAVYGLGLTVNQAQLIAAANICDEQVPCAGGTEARYACHYHFDTSTAPSDAFSVILEAMGGRYSMIGGECYLWPAAWVGPSFSFDESALTAPMQWDPTYSYKDLCNRVAGTYTAPNYPYNVAGNLYDSNGYYDGEIQNNFQFGFQPTSFPQYAADPLHGYAADEWLNEDSGVTAAWDSTTSFALGQVVSYTQVVAGTSYASVWRSLIAGNVGNTPGPTSTQWVNAANALPLEKNFNMVLSISQAQRLAKIALMRSRFPGVGTFEMSLRAFAMQEIDVMNFTFPLHGWTDKLLEVTDVTFKTITQEATPGKDPTPPERRISFQFRETDPSIYDWSDVEELTIDDVPALPRQQNNAPAPPTTMELISSAATALTAPDGSVTPRIEVTWDTPLDGFVTQIQVQYQLTGAAAWTNGPTVDVSLNAAYISPIIAGQSYDVRIRSLRPNGAASVWVDIDGFTGGLVVNSQGQIGVGIGSLIGEAYTDGTAGIECTPFTAYIGQLALPIFPGGIYTITGLLQTTVYWVYYVDPGTAGGNVTPIATTNKADFLGKQGYFLIDTIVTPYCSSTGTSARYAPSNYVDRGNRSTVNPTAPYDGSSSSMAVVSSIFTPTGSGLSGRRLTVGDCLWEDFPAVTTSAVTTLNIIASCTMSGAGTLSSPSAVITVTVSGTSTILESFSVSAVSATYTVSIPSGTVLSSITVEVTVAADDGGTSANSASVSVGQIYIQ